MRRREKFVIASILLSLGLLTVQYVPLENRYWAVGILTFLSFFVTAWALSDDLQRHEMVTIVPLPTLFTAAVGLFYFLLPTHLFSRIFILAIFAVGMYGLYLTSNIFSVAKGRSIQLLHAAHAIALLFTLIISVLFVNTIFSLKFVFWVNGLLVALTHFPLVALSLWSINLRPKLTKEETMLTVTLTAVLSELAIVLSLMPMSVWNAALFIMSVLYIGLGIFHNHLKGRLFHQTLNEYSLVALLVGFVYILLFPGK